MTTGHAHLSAIIIVEMYQFLLRHSPNKKVELYLIAGRLTESPEQKMKLYQITWRLLTFHTQYSYHMKKFHHLIYHRSSSRQSKSPTRCLRHFCFRRDSFRKTRYPVKSHPPPSGGLDSIKTSICLLVH